MSAVRETSRFQALKAKSLNALVNGKAPYSTWQPGDEQMREASDTMHRLRVTLEEGALLNAKEKRNQQLERAVHSTCYSSKNDLNFLEAQKCEQFHYQNDYKLNALKNYVDDHTVGIIKDYQSCINSIESINNNADKDRAFLACHNDWVKHVSTNFTQDLEARAFELFK